MLLRTDMLTVRLQEYPLGYSGLDLQEKHGLMLMNVCANVQSAAMSADTPLVIRL